jgi:SAM-dependent methyltransferase
MDATTGRRIGAPAAGDRRTSRGEIATLVDVCTWPSEAFWRAFELAVLKQPGLIEPPVLEVGCGDGGFTELASLRIDEAIDLNPRAVERARARTGVYASVHQQDLHDLTRERRGSFQTLFANSVLEHVADLERLLPLCYEVLRPGGRLVATVPLADMNRHLLISQDWYARMRSRQLQHRNLWTVDEWHHQLRNAGFDDVTTERYLDPKSCRYWDWLDFAAGWGFGRYRLAVALRLLARAALPGSAQRQVKRWVLDALQARYAATTAAPSDGCAALVLATKAS